MHRLQEKYLNSFKQFKMDCGNIDLHFVHERSAHPAAIPLVLLHGWPCNFTDFHNMIRPLTQPGEQPMCVLVTPMRTAGSVPDWLPACQLLATDPHLSSSARCGYSNNTIPAQILGL